MNVIVYSGLHLQDHFSRASKPLVLLLSGLKYAISTTTKMSAQLPMGSLLSGEGNGVSSSPPKIYSSTAPINSWDKLSVLGDIYGKSNSLLQQLSQTKVFVMNGPPFEALKMGHLQCLTYSGPNVMLLEFRGSTFKKNCTSLLNSFFN